MSATTSEDLVHWALHVRGNPVQARTEFTLSRAVSPELAQRALADPQITRKLAPIPDSKRIHAVLALAVIIRNRALRHNPNIPLGLALSHLTGDRAAMTLGLAAATVQLNAVRILDNALTRVASQTSVNLAEFVTLLTDWDELGFRARSRFLVDFYAADRA